MTEAEVRAVVTKSLGVKAADMKVTPNPTEGTSLLVVRVESLDPGPGPATITYIFGHKSKKLAQVNVVWGEEGASNPPDANAIIGTGTRLERYFQGFSWRKDTTRVGIPVGENTVVLFAGEDEKKGAVRLVVDGIKYQLNREGSQTTSPDPKGAAKLNRAADFFACGKCRAQLESRRLARQQQAALELALEEVVLSEQRLEHRADAGFHGPRQGGDIDPLDETVDDLNFDSHSFVQLPRCHDHAHQEISGAHIRLLQLGSEGEELGDGHPPADQRSGQLPPD